MCNSFSIKYFENRPQNSPQQSAIAECFGEFYGNHLSKNIAEVIILWQNNCIALHITIIIKNQQHQ